MAYLLAFAGENAFEDLGVGVQAGVEVANDRAADHPGPSAASLTSVGQLTERHGFAGAQRTGIA